MVRVVSQRSRPASAGPGPATARYRDNVRAANTDKPAYKVVVEEKLRPKKKLMISNYSTKEPPPGYTFVPAGDPPLTARCKEYSRQDGERIYVVSTTKHKETELSMQVHRIGYHFPSSIVDRACLSLGTTLEKPDRPDRPDCVHVPQVAGKSYRNLSSKGLKRIDKKALKHMHQAEVDQEARRAILDLFPAIPIEDLDVIIGHAFELGSKKVGTQVADLSLPRRVQLAVVAHIRHVYTDYDNVLKQVPWLQARSMVEQACLEKLAQWRGDVEDDPDAMEEILQEVIVIPDDDEDERDQPATGLSGQATRRPNASQPRPDDQFIDGGVRAYDPRSIASIRYLSVTPPTGMTHLGNGQYVVPRDEAWKERARHHQENAWRQAQDRVRNRQYAYPAEAPISRDDRPRAQQQWELHDGRQQFPPLLPQTPMAVAPRYHQPATRPQLIASNENVPPNASSQVRPAAHKLSGGDSYAAYPSDRFNGPIGGSIETTTGYRSNVRPLPAQASYWIQSELPGSKLARKEPPSSQSSRRLVMVPEPEEILPSVEPRTPRHVRQSQRSLRASDTDVIIVDYPTLDERPHVAEGADRFRDTENLRNMEQHRRVHGGDRPRHGYSPTIGQSDRHIPAARPALQSPAHILRTRPVRQEAAVPHTGWQHEWPLSYVPPNVPAMPMQPAPANLPDLMILDSPPMHYRRREEAPRLVHQVPIDSPTRAMPLVESREPRACAHEPVAVRQHEMRRPLVVDPFAPASSAASQNPYGSSLAPLAVDAYASSTGPVRPGHHDGPAYPRSRRPVVVVEEPVPAPAPYFHNSDGRSGAVRAYPEARPYR